METQFTGGKLIKQSVGVEACLPGDLPHPFGSAFELSESCLSLRNLVVPCRAGLSTGWPGRLLLFDSSKLCGLTTDGGLKAGLKVVDLLSLGLGIERQLGVVLQGKLFGAEEFGLGGGIVDVGANRWEKPRLRIPGFAAVVVRLEASIFLLR
jgi:hypothetical protein